jgi:flagellar hook-length control protein FliK
MVAPVLAEMFMKGATSLSQVAATGKGVTDKAFQKIFDSSMQNSNKAIQNTNENNEAKRSESETTKESSRAASKQTVEEADATRERTDTKEADSSKVERKNKESDDSASDSKKADKETVADKVEKLKKSDPESYNAMIANLDNTTLGGLLSTLGLNAADMSGLKPGVDLAGAVPEDLKQALTSDNSMAIGSALEALGIGGSDNGTSLPAFASQANLAIAGAASDVAGKQSANMKSDSQAVTTANANDSTSIPVSQSSSKEVSPDNSKSQSASSSVDSGSQSVASNADNGSQPASSNTDNGSQAGSSSADNGSQTGSSSADNANAGLGSNPGFSAATGANTPSPESTPQVKAVDPFQLVNPASQAANAPARMDGASQQVESKPAITTQNTTNQTDQASAVNTQQASKSDQPQTPSDTRAADAPRQKFERMVLDQVVDKARLVVRPNGVSSMVIKLDPPTLGRVDMRIEVKEGVVRAAIVAENHDVKNAIEGNIENLKKSLHASGLKVDEISVTVGGENGFQFKNDSMAQNASSQNQGDGRRFPNGQAANAPVAAADDSAPSRARTYAHSGILNVVA